MLAKFIDEGKREHEEMEIFIKEFRTTNELLLKERSNLLSELKIEVNELSKVMGNVLIPKSEVKGVTTRERKMMSKATPSKEINEIGINKKNIPDLKKMCRKSRMMMVWKINLRVFLKELLNHCLKNPYMEVLTEREIADEFPDEHLMVLLSKFKDDEPWYADFINYIVGKEDPYAFKLCADNIMRRCVAESETLEILAHCHSGPTGGHHSANVTGFYWPSVFKDAN
ncbi:hypothetical protein Tco_1388130, partial [Tanacetum coccineum]